VPSRQRPQRGGQGAEPQHDLQVGERQQAHAGRGEGDRGVGPDRHREPGRAQQGEVDQRVRPPSAQEPRGEHRSDHKRANGDRVRITGDGALGREHQAEHRRDQ
jgi:hypothetical protein